MGLPIVTGLTAVLGGVALMMLVGHVVPSPDFTVLVAALIGLGVGIDYALFIDDALEALVERSMLEVAFGRSGRRFRMIDTMRQFAADSLQSHGQTGLIAERHAQWYLRQVTRICHLLRGPDEGEGVARLGELWPNLRAGIGWACAAGDSELADALVRPIATEITLRAAQEIGDWAEDILAAAPPDNAELRAFWLLWVAERYVQNGDTTGYERVVRRHG
jgi:hypothetical protein